MIYKFLGILLVLFFSLEINVSAQSISDIKKQKAKTEKEIAYLNSLLKEAEKNKSVSTQKLNILRQKIQQSKKLLSSLNQEVGLIQNNISANEQRIKELEENKKSMLVLCASADMIVRYVNKAPGIAFEVMELATSPLTAILPGAAGLAENLIPDEGTLGVRIPDHEFCRRMLRALGRPIVSTSANISGEATPVGLQDVAREIIDGVDFVVNPRFEGKPTRKASSIIAFGEGGEVKIIRE